MKAYQTVFVLQLRMLDTWTTQDIYLLESRAEADGKALVDSEEYIDKYRVVSRKLITD